METVQSFETHVVANRHGVISEKNFIICLVMVLIVSLVRCWSNETSCRCSSGYLFSWYRPSVPIAQNDGSCSQIPYKYSGFIDDVLSDFSAHGSDVFNPEMEAACSSRTSVSPYSTARCTNPSNPFRSSFCWGVTQRVPNVSEQPIGFMFKNQAAREIFCIFCTLISIITLTNAYYGILKCKTNVFTAVFGITFHIIFQCMPSSHKWNPSYSFSNRRCMHTLRPRCCCRFLYLDYIFCMPVSKLQLLLCCRLCF